MPVGAASTADDVLAGTDLTGRIVVITGGTSGIGLETARALGAHGAEVIFTARSSEQAMTTLGRLRELVPGVRFRGQLLDLTSCAPCRMPPSSCVPPFRALIVSSTTRV